MPREWQPQIDKATVTHPEGHNTYCSVKWERQESHHTTVWFVRVPSQSEIPVVSPQFGIQECAPNTLKWRSATDILINLNQYVFQQSLVLIIQGSQRQHRAHQTQAGRPIVERTNLQRAPRRGIIEVCAGLGMMADSCVERGFASVIATCEMNELCHRLLKQKHLNAAHYCD